MNIVYELIRYSFYLLTLVFAWMVISPLIIPSIKNKRNNSRFVGGFEPTVQFKKPKSLWYRELELFLITTIGVATPFIVFSFVVVSSFLAILTGLFLYGTGSDNNRILIGAVISGALPAFILFIRRKNIRITSSYEGDELITELLAQYKLNHLNMIEAIDKTIPRLKKSKYTKRALTRLSLSIKENGSAEDLEMFTQEFSYTFATNWAQLLSNNIYMAIVYRDDVKEALEDILEELTGTKSINEKGNQENSESFLIIKYIMPIGYVISALAIMKYFDFSWKKFLSYQFHNPMGMKSFMLFALLLVFNYIIFIFMRRPKNDF